MSVRLARTPSGTLISSCCALTTTILCLWRSPKWRPSCASLFNLCVCVLLTNSKKLHAFSRSPNEDPVAHFHVCNMHTILCTNAYMYVIHKHSNSRMHATFRGMHIMLDSYRCICMLHTGLPRMQLLYLYGWYCVEKLSLCVHVSYLNRSHHSKYQLQ